MYLYLCCNIIWFLGKQNIKLLLISVLLYWVVRLVTCLASGNEMYFLMVRVVDSLTIFKVCGAQEPHRNSGEDREEEVVKLDSLISRKGLNIGVCFSNGKRAKIPYIKEFFIKGKPCYLVFGYRLWQLLIWIRLAASVCTFLPLLIKHLPMCSSRSRYTTPLLYFVFKVHRSSYGDCTRCNLGICYKRFHVLLSILSLFPMKLIDWIYDKLIFQCSEEGCKWL